MAARNLATSLKCRNNLRPMDRYDRLPPELRRWITTAALPWSASSVLRLWSRLHRETGGDVAAMTARLDQAERRMLDRDRKAIWGADYPNAATGTGRAVTARNKLASFAE